MNHDMANSNSAIWRKLKEIPVVLLTVLLMLAFTLPFFWLVSSSLKAPDELYKIPPLLWPTKLFYGNFVEVFETTPFTTYIKNSLFVAIITTVVCVIFGSTAAYSLSRIQIRGQSLVLVIILATSIFPGVTIAPALYLFLRKFRLINTYFSMILPYIAFFLPFTIWVLINFFKDIPQDLEDAAEIDGCTPLQALVKIIFPLAAPGVVTVSILNFINAWNEFFFAFVFTSTSECRTLPVGIVMFQGVHELPWGEISAASVVSTLPLTIVVIVLQRKIISGLTAGAIKG